MKAGLVVSAVVGDQIDVTGFDDVARAVLGHVAVTASNASTTVRFLITDPKEWAVGDAMTITIERP
jgi:hypothetical protein